MRRGKLAPGRAACYSALDGYGVTPTLPQTVPLAAETGGFVNRRHPTYVPLEGQPTPPFAFSQSVGLLLSTLLPGFSVTLPTL